MGAMSMVMSGMWLQDADSLSSGNSKLLMVFVGMVAIALSVQAIALIVMAIGAAKARKRGLEIVEELRAKAMPFIDDAHGFVRENAPKVKVITDNFVETSHVVRAKAQEFDVTASDVNRRTQAQVARVDGIVTSVLTTTTEIADTIQRGIKVPLREVSGLINGFKAGMDVLVGRAKSFGVHSTRTKDDGPGW
jgi:methyl-accepting chemotaxis protein